MTPLLERLELIERRRSAKDERVVKVHLTEARAALPDRCSAIPEPLAESLDYPVQKLIQLKETFDDLPERLREVFQRDR